MGVVPRRIQGEERGTPVCRGASRGEGATRAGAVDVAGGSTGGSGPPTWVATGGVEAGDRGIPNG